MGLYLMARAGHDYRNAAAFWRRMATVDPKAIAQASTHPTTSERFVALQKTVVEIDEKIAAGQPLLPERNQAQPDEVSVGGGSDR